MQQAFSYAAIFSASQRVNWQIEDIIGADKRLDFSKPFLPESLAMVANLHGLNADEKLVLNQIRGHNYLYIFGLVEEFILPFVLDHARPALAEDDLRTRAFLQFASEEAKHIHLFKCFRSAFEEGFRVPCEVIKPPKEFARNVLTHHPLSVALLVLHIEWMTQRHYVESVKDDRALDPTFASLLQHHWMEEAQHAKLDTLMVHELAAGCTPEEIANAVEEYLQLGSMIDLGLKQQVAFDLDAFERCTGRTLEAAERDEINAVQHQAMRWTFIGSGMTHRNFLDTVGKIHEPSKNHLTKIAPMFCCPAHKYETH